MKKKILGLFAMMLVVPVALVMVACGNSFEDRNHEIVGEWDISGGGIRVVYNFSNKGVLTVTTTNTFTNVQVNQTSERWQIRGSSVVLFEPTPNANGNHYVNLTLHFAFSNENNSVTLTPVDSAGNLIGSDAITLHRV